MSLNVLVVDDSAVVRKMIVKTLAIAGIELGDVHEAANGKEGLDVLASQWVDVVFVDLNMPVMGGEDMIDELRADPTSADLPILVISTEGSEARISQLKEKGVQFVHKPFTPEQIRNTISDMLELHHETDNV
jgi:two-component system chemotaxis response regulator CheY